MKTCGVCGGTFERGGKGPKNMDLCPAHYHRFRRGSKAWKDPSIRGEGAELERIRISTEAKEKLDSEFKDAKKKRPALSFHEFFDRLVIYLPDGWEEP